jgi:hypothetical protein|tara:strand:- start:49013 stop:49729 length:717 start_codon:yes stop_codon:yes gene_type:complete
MGRRLILGDEIIEKIDCEISIRYSELLEALEKKDKHIYEGVIFHIGQGLSQSERDTLYKISSQQKLFDINGKKSTIELKEMVHKKKSHNVMISEPIKNDDIYTSTLLLDDSCDEVSDHVTGLHIQGIVLFESCRQMMLAVSERFLFKKLTSKDQMRCILNTTNTDYLCFAFPVETQIKMKVENNKQVKKRQFCFKSTFQITQNERVVAIIQIDFLLVSEQNIAKLENKLYNKAIYNAV